MNALLVPAVRAGVPLVWVAVNWTPLSAFVYVTPVKPVAVFALAAICPVRVPPSVPVPAASESEILVVEPPTFAGFPN